METAQTSFDHLLRENPKDRVRRDATRHGSDRKLKLQFHGTKVTGDAGLLAYRQLDEVLGLTSVIDSELRDDRTIEDTRPALPRCSGSQCQMNLNGGSKH